MTERERLEREIEHTEREIAERMAYLKDLKRALEKQKES